MPITSTILLVNSAGVPQPAADLWASLAGTAMSQWSALLAGSADLTVRLEIVDSLPSGRAQGGVGGVIAVGAPNGAALEGFPGWELRHGVNSNGTNPDIKIEVTANYLLNVLFLDASPDTADDIPIDRADGLSVLLHEIGHALGMIGFYDEANGVFFFGSNSPFDVRLQFEPDGLRFSGPNSISVFGGPVPLTRGNYTHYGNSNARPEGGDPLTGLMNGVVFHNGFRYPISDLDLAILADVGLGTVRDDIFDQTWLDVIRGGPGLDRFDGNYSTFGSSVLFDASGAIWTGPGLTLHEIELLQLSLGAFNDSVSGSARADTVHGATGDDSLLGGDGGDRLFGEGDADALIGGAGDDTLNGGDGDDQLFAGLGHDFVDGGFGGDFARTSNGRDTLLGGDGNDTLGAGSGKDFMRGHGGADLLLGSNGNDRLYGDTGNDTLLGGGGRDLITGGAGDDRLVGGTEDDRFNFAPGLGADLIVDFEGGAGSGDVIGLFGFGASLDSFTEAIAAATQIGANVVIDLGGGDSITLQGVAIASLDADDFAFG